MEKILALDYRNWSRDLAELVGSRAGGAWVALDREGKLEPRWKLSGKLAWAEASGESSAGGRARRRESWVASGVDLARGEAWVELRVDFDVDLDRWSFSTVERDQSGRVASAVFPGRVAWARAEA